MKSVKESGKIQVGGNHYKNLKIQPTKYCIANRIPFADGNVIKYISRHPYKNKEQDVLKALHYCLLILENEYRITPPMAWSYLNGDKQQGERGGSRKRSGRSGVRRTRGKASEKSRAVQSRRAG